MRTVTTALGVALTGGALVLAAAVPAQASGSEATLTSLSQAPHTIIFSPGTPLTPLLAGLDTDGDKQTDAKAYCIEPSVKMSSGFLAHTQKLTANSLSSTSFVKDKGRLAWVLGHGYGVVDQQTLATKAGANLTGMAQSDIDAILRDATQAAVWKYSSGLSINPYFRYGDYTGGPRNTLFTKVYAYLTLTATPVDAGGITVWNEKPGEANTQAVVEVPDKPAPDSGDCPVCQVVTVPQPQQTCVSGPDNDKVVLPPAPGVIWVPGTWSHGTMTVKAVSADGYTFPQGDEITFTLVDPAV